MSHWPRRLKPRRLLPVASATTALMLVFAVGCGSAGGGASTGEPGSASTAATPPNTTPAAQGAPSAGSANGESDFGPAPKSAAAQSASARHDSAPFETKGGDNSIQESGSEASSSELDQAAVVLHGYLDSRAAGSWGRACTFVTPGLIASMRQLAGGAGAKLSCPKLFASLSAGLPAAALREAAIAEVGALRVKGDSAFLLFHGAHGADYFISMVREGGEWKVAALAPSPLG
jgi:hypothetical protein